MPCPNQTGCPRKDGQLKDYCGLNLYAPARVYAPTVKAELVAAVIEIEGMGMRAKAVGSYMSLSPAARSDNCAILTDDLNRHLSEPLNAGGMSWPDRPGDRFRRTENILNPILSDATGNRQPRLIYVEAGIKIHELLADLSHTGILRSRNNGEPGLLFLQIVLNPNLLTQCWIEERRLYSGDKVEVGLKNQCDALQFFCKSATEANCLEHAVGICS